MGGYRWGLKAGERLVEGALREVLEETGLVLREEQMEFYDIYDDPSRIANYPDGNVWRIITVVYRVRLAEQPALICSEESRELRFFSREALRKVKVAATHIPIVEGWKDASEVIVQNCERFLYGEDCRKCISVR